MVLNFVVDIFSLQNIFGKVIELLVNKVIASVATHYITQLILLLKIRRSLIAVVNYLKITLQRRFWISNVSNMTLRNAGKGVNNHIPPGGRVEEPTSCRGETAAVNTSSPGVQLEGRQMSLLI